MLSICQLPDFISAFIAEEVKRTLGCIVWAYRRAVGIDYFLEHCQGVLVYYGLPVYQRHWFCIHSMLHTINWSKRLNTLTVLTRYDAYYTCFSTSPIMVNCRNYGTVRNWCFVFRKSYAQKRLGFSPWTALSTKHTQLILSLIPSNH